MHTHLNGTLASQSKKELKSNQYLPGFCVLTVKFTTDCLQTHTPKCQPRPCSYRDNRKPTHSPELGSVYTGCSWQSGTLFESWLRARTRCAVMLWAADWELGWTLHCSLAAPAAHRPQSEDTDEISLLHVRSACPHTCHREAVFEKDAQ